MELSQAYFILGAEPEDNEKTIKEKYRRLMFKHHPDSFHDHSEVSLEKTQIINEAYSIIRKHGSRNVVFKTSSKWGAEIIVNAFHERTVFISGGEYEGYRISNIPVAKGTYEWDPELEEFDMLLFSLNKLTQDLLEEEERREGIYGGDTDLTDEQKRSYHIKLFHLLTQQFIDPIRCLKRIAVPEKQIDGSEIYYFKAELKILNDTETVRNIRKLKPGDILIPLKFEENKIQTGTTAGDVLGYLSFLEDELYYILIPILKAKLAKLKIEVPEGFSISSKRRRSYFPVDLYIKLESKRMPERDLNILIRKVLAEYRSHIR